MGKGSKQHGARTLQQFTKGRVARKVPADYQPASVEDILKERTVTTR